MDVVCSYCQKVIRRGVGGGSGVSHGMCGECDRHFERLWGGMTLDQYLEELPQPIALVDATLGRVVAANRAMGEVTGRAPHELRGLLGGEAMACARSRLPEGCGKTVHCRECAIRRTVQQVAATGRPVSQVPAYLVRDGWTLALRIGVRPAYGFCLVTVEEARPDDGERATRCAAA